MPPKDYSKKEAAELLGTTPDAIQKRIKREKIEAYKNEKGQWRVVLDDKEINKKQSSAKSGAKSTAKKSTGTSSSQKAGRKTATSSAASKAASGGTAGQKAASSSSSEKSVSPEKTVAAVTEEETPKSPVFCRHTQEINLDEQAQQKGSAAKLNYYMKGGPIMVDDLINKAKEMIDELKEKAPESVEQLIEKGEMQKEEARKVTERFTETRDEIITEYQAKFAEIIGGLRNKVVTREDIEELDRKIEALNRKLQDM